MPYEIDIDPANGLARIYFRCTTLFGEGIVEAAQAVFFHPLWERGFSTLWLTEEVKSIVVLPKHVEAYEAAAPGIRAKRGPGRSAVVTSKFEVELTALMLALKTAGDAKGSDRSFRLFKDVAAAEAWLARSEEVPPLK